MNDAPIYFLKVNVAIALFYLFYRLFFAGDTFWKTRRYYMLLSILLSFLYPFLSVENWLQQQEPVQRMIIDYAAIPEFTITAVRETTIFTLENISMAIYGIVVMTFLVRFIIQLISILRIRLRGTAQMVQGTRIIVIEKEIAPFSFFGSIFMNPTLHNEHETKEILAHELTHVRQWHSFDVLVSEFLTILFWFNPATWLLKREIRQNLEFLADHKVIESGFDSQAYQYHLLQLSYQTPEHKLGNKFNVSPLKKRIIMMNQQKSAKARLLKYSLIVPLALALVVSSNAQTVINKAKKALSSEKTAVSTKKEAVSIAVNPTSKNGTEETLAPAVQDDKNTKVFDVVEKMPAFPGGDKELMAFLSKNVKYPVIAHENNIQGKVILSFVVNSAGKVTNPQILRSLDPSLDKEALRVVSLLPDFIPGEQNMEKVNVRYTLPIVFRLAQEPDNKMKAYTVVEKMPQFPGGDQALMQYLGRNVKYPVEAQKTGTQGRVIVQFIVSATGKIEDVTAMKSIMFGAKKLDEVVVVGYGAKGDEKTQAAEANMALLEKEAARVASTLPDFIPGEQNGNKVAVYFTLPVIFKLN